MRVNVAQMEIFELILGSYPNHRVPVIDYYLQHTLLD